MASGETTIDFGVFPGKSDASVDVTGQGAIVSGSVVGAWLHPQATADHSADEHMVETIQVYADPTTIIAGTGFTIKAFNTSQLNEQEPPQFITHQGQNISGTPRQAGHWPSTYSDGKGTRIYGVWQLAWAWV